MCDNCGEFIQGPNLTFKCYHSHCVFCGERLACPVCHSLRRTYNYSIIPSDFTIIYSSIYPNREFYSFGEEGDGELFNGLPLPGATYTDNGNGEPYIVNGDEMIRAFSTALGIPLKVMILTIHHEADEDPLLHRDAVIVDENDSEPFGEIIMR